MKNMLERIPLLNPDDIEIRIGQINKQKKFITLLLYKNARVDMQILDEVFGTFGWKRTHKLIGNNLYCTLSLWDEDRKQWVEKEDVGTESNMEAEKGAASDSLKRSSFSAGIGRELYSAPAIRIYPPDCLIEESNGKLVCWDRFVVSEISYTDGRKINYLEISKEGRNGQLTPVFSWTKPASRNKNNGEKTKDEADRNAYIESINHNLMEFAALRGQEFDTAYVSMQKRFNVVELNDVQTDRLQYISDRVATWYEKALKEHENTSTN